MTSQVTLIQILRRAASHPTQGRAFFDNMKAAGKTSMDACAR
jgi:hypothetical protein